MTVLGVCVIDKTALLNHLMLDLCLLAPLIHHTLSRLQGSYDHPNTRLNALGATHIRHFFFGPSLR